MSSIISHKHFLIIPKEGEIFRDATQEDQFVSLSELCVGINDSSTQLDFLKKIGITFIDDENILLSFKEKGNAYLEPKGDRTKKENSPTTESFSLKLPLYSKIQTPIPIKVSLDPFIEDGVNFLGRVTFKTPTGKERSIPLTGTGTVALEGRYNDCHAGLCTGPACASFQEKVAIIFGVCACVGVREENMELLGLRLQKISTKYHGRGDLLDYTVECACADSPLSYLEFLKSRYDGAESVPPMLEVFLKDEPPLEGYYEKLKQRFPAELIDQQKADWESHPSSESYFSKFSQQPYGVFAVCGTVATAVCIYMFCRK